MNEPDPHAISVYFQRFLDSRPADLASPVMFEAFQFGDSPELADELAALVLQGAKTATCGDLWSCEAEDQPLPAPGAFSVVLDGAGRPVAVIETVEVMLHRFDEVDEQFAFEEGEGDRSLAYWRSAHRRFFTRTLPRIGREFSEDMPLVCERFRTVFR